MLMTHNKHTIGPISHVKVARIVQMRTRHMKPVLTKLNITLDSNSGISSGRLIRIDERVAIRASISLLALGGNKLGGDLNTGAHERPLERHAVASAARASVHARSDAQ